MNRVGSKSPHVLAKLVAFATLVAAVVVSALPADALVTPTRSIDDTVFPAEADAVQLMALRIDVTPVPATRAQAQAPIEWELEAELVLRSLRAEPRAVDVLVSKADATAEPPTVYANGVPIRLGEVVPSFDPALRDHRVDHAARATIPLAPGRDTIVRVTGIWPGERDALGRHFLRLPLHHLTLWSNEIESSFIDVSFEGRPVALETSIADPVRYDEPEAAAAWYLQSWSPSRSFEVAYLPAWAALLLVAQVEECPSPWEVVQRVSRSDMSGCAEYLADFDAQTLQFCAALPLVLHGHVFESAQTRQQFSEVPARRYIPRRTDDASIYQPNPRFEESMLAQPERIYRATLRNFAQDRLAP